MYEGKKNGLKKGDILSALFFFTYDVDSVERIIKKNVKFTRDDSIRYFFFFYRRKYGL